MKVDHTIELGGQNLTLSLSFQTSLQILQKVHSPSGIVQSVLEAAYAAEQGVKYDGEEFPMNEENAIKILAIGNEPYENLGFEAIGELAMNEGLWATYGMTLAYLKEMVVGRSKKAPQQPESSEEKPVGQSS